jgi:ubiquitin C-terminal hydrolase
MSIVGFANIGQSCYLNSVLQCILNDELFVKFINETTIDAQIIKLLSEIKRNPTFTSLYKFKTYMSSKNSIFKNISQEDSPTALRILLDTIHNECCDKEGSKFSVTKNKDFLSLAKNAYKRHIMVDGYSIINKLYKGQLYVSCVCSNCSHVSSGQFDIFGEIIVELDKDSIHECVDSFLNKIEIIEDYACEKCNKRTNVYKKNNIIVFPKRLIIYLNRYKSILKNIKNIHIDKNLYFTSINDKTIAYELSAVVHHTGQFIDRGHYVTDIIKENIIYRADDDIITKIDYLNDDFVSNSAYLMIYNRI